MTTTPPFYIPPAKPRCSCGSQEFTSPTPDGNWVLFSWRDKPEGGYFTGHIMVQPYACLNCGVMLLTVPILAMPGGPEVYVDRPGQAGG